MQFFGQCKPLLLLFKILNSFFKTRIRKFDISATSAKTFKKKKISAKTFKKKHVSS